MSKLTHAPNANRHKIRFFLGLYANFERENFEMGRVHSNEQYLKSYMKRNPKSLNWIEEYCFMSTATYPFEVLHILGGIKDLDLNWRKKLVKRALKSKRYAVRDGALSAIDKWTLNGEEAGFIEMLIKHEEENIYLDSYRNDILAYISY